MKLLTIIIPSFNSEKWIQGCLESLLVGLDDKLEVIVINDGSKDRTSEIAHAFCEKHPFARVIDKENGGHGSGINVGLKNATGLYFKVLDSDDHLDSDGLHELIDIIEKHQAEGNLPDVYLADYISVLNGGDNRRKINTVKKYFKKHIQEVVSFDKIKRFSPDFYIMMHAVFTKTELLKETHMELLEHTFYEDNQYVYHVLIHANTYCHLDKPIYLYTVGLSEQSISPQNMSKNYKHQLRVMDAMFKEVSYDELKAMHKMHQEMVFHELFIESCLSYFYIYIDSTKEKNKEYKDMYRAFKLADKKLYKRLRWRTLVSFMHSIPPFFRKTACRIGYNTIGKKKGWKF